MQRMDYRMEVMQLVMLMIRVLHEAKTTMLESLPPSHDIWDMRDRIEVFKINFLDSTSKLSVWDSLSGLAFSWNKPSCTVQIIDSLN